jgi:predicted phage tail protein
MDKNRIVTLLKSKTFWGALFAAGAWLAAQPHVGVVEIMQAVGTVMSAAGIRDAITKATAP